MLLHITSYSIPLCAHAFSFLMPAWKNTSSLRTRLYQNQVRTVCFSSLWSTWVHIQSPYRGKPPWNDARMSQRTTMTAVPSSGQDENSYWSPGRSASSHWPSQCHKPVHTSTHKYILHFINILAFFNRHLPVFIVLNTHHSGSVQLERRVLYFANWQILNELHDCIFSGWESVLAIGFVLVAAHLGKHHVWSNSYRGQECNCHVL